MCRADAGLVTWAWIKGREYPYPDFSVYVSNSERPLNRRTNKTM